MNKHITEFDAQDMLDFADFYFAATILGADDKDLKEKPEEQLLKDWLAGARVQGMGIVYPK